MRAQRHSWRVMHVVAIGAVLLACAVSNVSSAEFAAPATATVKAAAYRDLPMVFEANRGQVDPGVLYLARGDGYQVLLSADATTIRLRAAIRPDDLSRPTPTAHALVTLTFPGAEPTSRLVAERAVASTSNYFAGDDASLRIVGIPHFERVRRTELYPGIDLVYYGSQGAMEFDFVVAPGADPARIRLCFQGVERIALDADGDLVLHTQAGDLRQHRPAIFQQEGASRRRIEGRYVLIGDNEAAIGVDDYNHAAALVIDPVLSYSTFLGGRRGYEAGTAIAVDAAGNAYVTGTTDSTDFPLISGYDTRLANGDQDVFVAKLNATGTALVYSTYLGGAKGIDYPTAIAVDAQGNAYVTGSTSGVDFPTTSDAYQKAPASGGGSFVAKLGPAGSTLVYSSYLQGASQTRIAVDAAGNAYIAGQAVATFPTTSGAFQTAARSPAGGPFVLALNASGSALRFSTFLGGSGTDTLKAMAIDAAGNVYVAGATTSADYPVRNALQGTLRSGLDGYVSKLDPAGAALVYSTYLGGSLDDSINALAIDSAGNAYVAGETYSADFPTRNAAQSVKSGQHLVNSSQGNAFVAKLSATGSSLTYSTFLGGEICYPYYCSSIFGATQISGDAAFGLAVDGQGHAVVTGIARSFTFPLASSLLQEKQQEDQESLFVAKLSQGGHALLFSSLIYTGFEDYKIGVNGAPMNAGQAIAVDTHGDVYLTKSGASNFPTTTGALQASSAGGDAVVLKLAAAVNGLSLTAAPNPAIANQTLTLTATGASPNTPVAFYDGRYVIGIANINAGAASLTTTLTAGIHYIWASYADTGNVGDSKPILLVVNPSSVCD
ncbi:MAG TPA: SBBP repeat-containing protein [Casimicrobiaceae bacterium]|nr:SBBP repeat-containing protein [Casimicrobiaceae bacterium]